MFLWCATYYSLFFYICYQIDGGKKFPMTEGILVLAVLIVCAVLFD